MENAQLGQCIRTWPVRALRWHVGRNLPWNVLEVKELRHVGGHGVPLGQIRQAKSNLNQPKDRGIFGRRVRDKILPGKWRNHHQGNPKASAVEIAGRIGRVAGDEIAWGNAIGAGHLLGPDILWIGTGGCGLSIRPLRHSLHGLAIHP